MKGSLIIVAFFIAGIACGLMHLLPDLNAYGNVSYLTLCALLFAAMMAAQEKMLTREARNDLRYHRIMMEPSFRGAPLIDDGIIIAGIIIK